MLLLRHKESLLAIVAAVTAHGMGPRGIQFISIVWRVALEDRLLLLSLRECGIHGLL